MALDLLDEVKDAGMGSTRLQGVRCDSRGSGMFGIGERAFCQRTAPSHASLRSRQASSLGLVVFARVQDSEAFLTSLLALGCCLGEALRSRGEGPMGTPDLATQSTTRDLSRE
jgi:hypothetical protein